jgi:protein-lysine N-methyltransferase EEF2KMT
MNPIPPSSSLPSLAQLSKHSLGSISSALSNLRSLYFPAPPPKVILFKRHLDHQIHDSTVPDSGYASAEEDDPDVEEGDLSVLMISGSDPYTVDVDILRSDTFEREFSIKWLTGFIGRADIWLANAPSDPADNEGARANVIDEAASLLSAFAGDLLEPESALTRTFSFPCDSGYLKVQLNDAPLSITDHTSVGLQSWASSIVLAERLCKDPNAFFGLDADRPGLRILELGAGTGMLSIVASKLLPAAAIIATDYHLDVLSNLSSNIATNAPSSLSPISMHTLDWSQPPISPPFDVPFDIILAADVIYHPMHAQWIKCCIKQYLARDAGAVFWLIIPLRSTGRHEGMGSTVERVFVVGDTSEGSEQELVILSKEEIARKDGVGRADEGSYVLFRIGWLFHHHA